MNAKSITTTTTTTTTSAAAANNAPTLSMHQQFNTTPSKAPATTLGTTASGLKYYILPAKKPSGTAELELLVNVGSLNEEDHEQGYAHFIEHLGFKSTKNFPNYEIVKELETIGCQYGPDVNASTHLLETKFRLSLDVDKELAKLKKGIFILGEWAFGMQISEKDVEEERQVILAEYRAKHGLSRRMLNNYWPQVFTEKSRISHRMPIGIPDIFMNVKNSDLSAFYRKYYTPDNMSIIISGDFGDRVPEIEAYLRRTLDDAADAADAVVVASGNPWPAAPPRLDMRTFLPEHSDDVMVSLTDKEIYAPCLCFEFCFPTDVSVHYSSQNEVCFKLVSSLINYRFQKILHGVCANPFIQNQASAAATTNAKQDQSQESATSKTSTSTTSGGGSDGQGNNDSSSDSISSTSDLLPMMGLDDVSMSLSDKELVRGLKCFGLTVRLHKINVGSEEHRKKSILGTICAIIYELDRIKKFGFTKFEMERAKSKWNERFAEVISECEKGISSSSTVAMLEKHALSNEVYPIHDIYENAKEMQDLCESMTPEYISSFLQMIDFQSSHDSSSSAFYKANFENSDRFGIVGECFRVLTSQLPTAGIDNTVLRDMLAQARALVGEQTVEPWASTRKLTHASDVIGAAQCLLYNDVLQKYKSEVKRRSNSVSETPGEGEGDVVDFKKLQCCAKCNRSTALPAPATLVSTSSASGGGSIAGDYIIAYCLECSSSTGDVNSASVPVTSISADSVPQVVHMEAVDTHLVVLDNGIQVSLKYFPVEWPNKIALQGFCLRGTSDLDIAESYMFSILDDLARTSGFTLQNTNNPGGDGDNDGDYSIILDGNDVKDIEAHNGTSVSIQKHNHHRGVGGSCTKDRLELLLSFLCLKFSRAQNMCEKELKELKNAIIHAQEAEKVSPYIPFLDRAQELACGQEYVHLQTFDKEKFEALTIEDVRRLYQREFVDDFGNFTFTFVGDMPPLENMVQLLNSYIGRMPILAATTTASSATANVVSIQESHPSSPSPSLPRPFKVFPIEHRRTRVRETMTFESDNDKSSAMIAFSCIVPENDREDLEFTLKVDFCCKLLQSRLLEMLRIKLGKVYSVSVEKSRNSLSPNMLITIGFHCSMDDVDELMLIIESEIRQLQTEGPLESEVRSVLEIMTKNHSQALLNPSYWIFWILDSFKSFKVESFNSRPVTLSDTTKFVTTSIVSKTADRCSIISSFNPRAVAEGMTHFFNMDRATLVDLKPATQALSEPSLHNMLKDGKTAELSGTVGA